MSNKLIDKLKNDNFFCLNLSILIIIIHSLLEYYGCKIIDIDNYGQLINEKFLNKKDIFESLTYFHSNPPFLSIIFYLSSLWNIDKYVILENLLISLHIISMFFFNKTITVNYNIRFSKLITVVLFLNPLIFIYFKYPFTSSLIFFFNIILLYIITSSHSHNKKLLLISIIFSILILLRASFQIIIIFMFCLPFLFKANSKKIIVLSLIIFLVPFSWYSKNFYLFNKFTSSTWLGINLSNHSKNKYTKDDNKKITYLGKFSSIEDYSKYIDFNNSKYVKKFINIKSLNNNDLNNIRYILVSDEYMKNIIQNFNLFFSLKMLAYGINNYLESPSDYSFTKGHMTKCFGDFQDIFDLPDYSIEYLNRNIDINFSFYFIYIFVILYCLMNLNKLNFNEKFLLIYLVFFSALYSFIDIAENNRMRFEFEPLFYFFTLLTLNKLKILKVNSQK